LILRRRALERGTTANAGDGRAQGVGSAVGIGDAARVDTMSRM
jgi:hypothetical protein